MAEVGRKGRQNIMVMLKLGGLASLLKGCKGVGLLIGDEGQEVKVGVGMLEQRWKKL